MQKFSCSVTTDYLHNFFRSVVVVAEIMENVEAESKDEAMRGSKTAIRCAKAAFLLSSLKSSQNRQLRATAHEQAKVLKVTIYDHYKIHLS